MNHRLPTVLVAASVMLASCNAAVTSPPPASGPSDDLAVLDVFIESTGCGVTAAETVVAKVANFGPADIAVADIELAVSFDGGLATTTDEVIAEVIPAGGSVLHHFGAIDLSVAGTYELTVTVTIPDDGLPQNDSQSLTVENVSGATTLPYAEDFESGAAGWTVHGADPSWALAMPAGAIIDSAGSGDYAWVTNPAGEYGAYETGYLESPCLDFTGVAGTVVLTFWRIFDIEACCDGGWVELSTDGGATWTKLTDDGSATGWYNDTANQRWAGATDGWQEATIDLPAGTSGTAVRLRFVFTSDGTISSEGLGIDHVRVSG